MNAWPWPWPQPASVWDDAGPSEPLVVDFAGASYWVAPTNETGVHTGRRRYRVECLRCCEELHEGTTSPRCMIEQHATEAHGWRRPRP